MGKASISIAVTGSYNGAAIDRAQKQLDSLAKKTAANSKTMAAAWEKSGSDIAELGGRIYSLGDRADSLGQSMTRGITVPLAAAGAGALAAGIDFDTAGSTIEAACGGATDEAARLEAAGRTLYKDGWGESMTSLSTSLVRAREILGDLSQTDMSYAVEGAMTLEQAYGSDFSETLRGVNVLMKKFGLSATEATDLMVSGTQRGLDYTKELGDNLSEYSGRWADAGMSASQYFSLLEAGAQGGAYQLDKVGDFLNEFLTSLTDGRMEEGIGNFSEGTRSAFEAFKTGGATAEDVLNAVVGEMAGMEDGYKRAQIASELWSSLGEDNAMSMITALSGVDDTFTDVSGAAQQAGDKISDNLANKATSALRTAQEAVEPFASAAVGVMGDAADAAKGVSEEFSKLDSGTQTLIVGGAALAAAAGPVISVSGKIVKGAGNVVTAYGKAKQELGVYADALTTTDAAALKTYSSNDKLARALKSNGAVKAAGDVDTYVSAVQAANRDTSAYERAVKALSNEQKKGSKANSDLVANLKAEVVEKRNAMNSSTGIVNGYRQEATAATASTAATKAHAVGLAAMTTAANVAKVALATIAPIAIITGITMLAQAFMGAKQHADDLSAATDGLTAATSGATVEVEKEAGLLDVLSGSASGAKVDIDGMLQSQAQLAQTITETNTNAAAQTAQLQSAYATIQQYANHSDLSTDAQNRLRAAVETVNQMCGTQISVTDAANGKLADENGALEDVTGSMSGYIEKKLEQIRVDAQQQNLSALYQQQATDIETLTKAQQAYNDKQSERDQYIKDYIAMCGPYVTNAEEMAQAAWEGTLANSEEAKAVKEAQSALDAVNTSIDNVSSSLTASAAATDGAAASISNLAMASPVVSSAINAVGGDINDFSNDLADAGISVEQFRGLNESQLTQLVASWQGQTGNIVSALDGMGVEMQDKGVNAANALATGLSTGRLSVDASTAALKAAASGDWSGVVSTMRDNGVNIPDAVASGITANGYKPTAATSSMLSAVALKLTGGDVKAAAELLGGDIDAGLANGIMSGTLSEEQASLLGEDVIAKAKDALQSHSPSQAFYQIGSDVDAGMAQGISGNTTGPLDAIGQLGQSLVDAVSGLPGEMQTTGSNSSSGLAGGLSSGLGSVFGAATSLFSNAVNGTSATPGTLSATGRSAGSGFASNLGSYAGAARGSGSALSSSAQGGVNGSVSALSGTGSRAGSGYASGVGAASGSARGSGSRLASSASSGASGWSAYQSGSHLGSQFASGIGSAWSAVKSFASSLVNAAKSVMGFSVPDEGPWSGAEKGGVTSGMHLGQNFAKGMSMAGADVRDAAVRLAKDADIDATGTYRARVTGGGKSASGTTVVNNYYTMGDVLVNASDFDEYMTMEQFFRFMRRAKAGR